MIAIALMFLCAFICTDAATGGQDYQKYLEKQAFRLWNTCEFLNMYEHVLENDTDISEAEQTVKAMLHSRIKQQYSTGLATSLMKTQYTKMVDGWSQQGFINQGQREELKSLEGASDAKKTIRELVFDQGNGQVIYGLVGHAEADTTTIAVVHAFMRFEFSQRAVTVQPTSSKKNCEYWNTYCKPDVKVTNQHKPLTGQEAEHLMDYFRFKTLSLFEKEHGPTIKGLREKAERLRSFLPKEIQEALKKIDTNPETPIDEILASDPFNPRKYKF